MSWLITLVTLLHGAGLADSARLVGSNLVVEPVSLIIGLPPQWLGAKDSVPGPPTCGHKVHGAIERRLAVSRPMLDSLRHAGGEWDREYSAVTDSILPFDDLIAQAGPEPFGQGSCFLDLQVRVYVGDATPRAIASSVSNGLRVARSFFPSATLSSADSARWHIDRLRWDARYYDYGAEANVEIFSTVVGARLVSLVFMRATMPGGFAERDQHFILDHLRLH